MQTIIKCSNCGIDLAVDQTAASGVYSCPSCGTHFQVGASPATAADLANAPEPVIKKPALVMTPPQPRSVASHSPAMQRPGLSLPHSNVYAAKPSDKTIPIIIGSIAALCIICVTVIIINSKGSGNAAPAQTAQVVAKPTHTDVRKGIEEKAQEFLDASAPTVERELQEAKEEQEEFDAEMERQRKFLASMYGEKYFDGDEDAGQQFVLAIEEILERMPESEEQAREWLVEKMTENPVLKPFLAKIDEMPFSEGSNKGPTAFLKQYQSFGTGFFISADGWIVSNRHVVGNAKEVDVRLSDGTTHRAKVVKKDQAFDLALIKVDAKAHKCLPISKGNTDLGLGRPVFTIGFPNPMLQGIEPKYTDGKVSATAGLGDDKNFYQISIPVQPGNSGGAMVDAETGWVVGVITLRLESTADGRSAQNVSYAIKSSALHGFVENFNNSGSDKIAIAASKASSANNAIELAKDSAVQILVPREAAKPEKDDE